ncbi:hypothetical protein EF888_16625 [Silicimonas algicola]|uniref:Uncharacterized protein YdeI (YjbR/CyaY-like superfamily) n=1 Tax=Silicimonas algicola TaxID=1826607 RepID=A0A316G604_9RHOB|nr:YdeI/OmpD-associated family protein [Silicimonas algicola]AZQ68612.1 hypothetical protein EF888_16625 [Silicimonas algicola]PWK55665.1 uncharacterized protein YdeI (YjbR/CyaY-like superfamily) [Silicimonas algicola]
MGDADRRAGVFYDRAGAWADEMRALRAILLASPLDEAFKWRQPVYMWEGANLALVGAFRADCVLSFFKGVLLTDPEGILVPPGDNSRSARVARFTSVEDIETAAPALRALIDEAIRLESEGAMVDLPKDDLDPPAELIDALDADEPLREAFEALTPGRRRSWILHLNGAKQSATRSARIEKARDRILAGKGLNDR